MATGPRRASVMECSALKPRMHLAEGAKAVMRFAGDKPAMQLAGAAQSAQELIRDLQRAVAAQAERLGTAEQQLASTRGRLGAATRKLAEKEVAAARAERARSQAAESAQRLQQELAAARGAIREKDAAIELLRADHQELRQGLEQAAQVRAQLAAASMEACATAQRARELEQRVRELEKPAVATGGSPERWSRQLPSAPAGSPKSSGSSREGSTEACSTLGSVSWAPTSVGAPDTQAESNLTALAAAESALCALRAESAAAEAALRAELAAARERVDCAAAEADSLRRLLDVEREAATLPGAEERERSEIASRQRWLAELQGQQQPADVPPQAVQGPELNGETGGARRRRRKRGKKGAPAQDAVGSAPERNPEHTWQFVLSIDTVCHRMAEFIPFEWAQFSCMAPMVLEVVGTWVNYWGYGAIQYCWHMQSSEFGVHVHDPRDFGPPWQAQRDLLPFHGQLKREIRLRGPDLELQRRLLRRVEMAQHIFDEFRIRFADLFEEVNPFFQSMRAFHTNLGDALRSREARVGAAAAAAD